MDKKCRYYWDIILTLTHKEIKIRYKNNVLGYVWSILNPLASGMVFFVAFQIVMKVKMENYLLFLLSGLFPWQWLANSVNQAPHVFIGSATLIKKVNFPRYLIPITVILQDGFHFLLSLPVFAAFLLVYGMTPDIIWTWGIPLMTVVTLFTVVGAVLLVSTLNLFFRDMANLVMILVNMLFYFTPILYSAEMVPAQFQPYIAANPVAPLFICWRGVLYHGALPLHYLWISMGYAVALCIVGALVYRKLSWKFAEVL